MKTMIGQQGLIKLFRTQIEYKALPRFSILVGPPGSGKRRLADIIYSMYQKANSKSRTYVYTISDNKVDTVRQMIRDAYTVKVTTFFILPDADKMSLAAKNALLKVTEEPPNKAFFIMTLEDENHTLSTIRSRGTVYHMEYYSPKEIQEFIKTTLTKDGMAVPTDIENILVSVCETPGDVTLFLNGPTSISEFYEYVELVVDDVAEVSDANAFKIADKIALKDEEDKFDLRLFWRAFCRVCLDRMFDNAIRYGKGIEITSKYIQQLRITGINRPSTFDMWLLEIRDAWWEES